MTRVLERRRRSCRRAARAGVAMLVFACALISAPGAFAAAPLSWSAPSPVRGGAAALSAVSCASETLCVAVNAQGRAFTTVDPAEASPAWAEAVLEPGTPATSVSCAAPATCVAVDDHGDAFASFDGFHWTAVPGIDGTNVLTGVSCPTAGLCVAVDEAGNLVWATNLASAGGWHSAPVDGVALKAVSCASSTLCVAVDAAGDAIASSNPTGGSGAWVRHQVDPGSELASVSCIPSGACVAGDAGGTALASQDPTSSAPTWSLTSIDSARLAGVTCASSNLCVAVDTRGVSFASDGIAAPEPGWRESSAELGRSLSGVACEPGGFCVAVDREGRSLLAHVPAPAATTATIPAVVRNTSATLAGVVSPNDAVLGACIFEYGTGVPYAQAVPCSVLPVPAGGAQVVSAEVGGLEPNTTYHYRLLVSDAAGASAGLDVAFTTAVTSGVPLVSPHPSISGNPAVGQRLTCHSGISSGAEAQVTYAWLRDLIPIAGASSSTYTVKAQDSGHHLQCQVTAADAGGSVTVKSAFVTIPQGGVPASSGETFVGRARFTKGKVNVPITCSPNAFSGCQITLRVTVVEAISGRRIVAVSATPPRRGSRSAALRHSTVTLASARTHVSSGSRRTVVATLNSSGRRLIAAKGSFAATLSVSGTVIGLIESALAHQTLVLASSSHGTTHKH